MKKSRWSNRALTSLLTLCGFLIMALTGLVLYVVPHGRIAYWVEWKFLGLTKELWGDIHTLGMFLFLVAGILHIYFNWKPLIGYLKNRARTSFALRKELVVATLIGVLFVVSAIAHLKPLSYLLDLGAEIKDSWVTSPDYEPPFGHAEILSLKVFCKKTRIPLDEAIATMNAAGFEGVDESKLLVDIARANDMSSRDLYQKIQHLEAPLWDEAPPKDGGLTPGRVEEVFAGSGMGRKTIADVAEELGIDPKTIEARLKRNGLTFESDQGVKTIAAKNGIAAPMEVLKAMLVDGYAPRR